jgi:predicted ribosomally synthesized peptide with SipW-like signal peptide
MKRIVLFVLCCSAALSIGAAGAYFTSQAQVPENLVKAGEVAISTEPTSAAISMDALAPGVTVTKPLTVVNTGGLPLNFVVTAAKKAGITEFYEALQCRVTSDGTLLYEGPLTTLKTTPLPLPAGVRTQLQVAMSLPATAGNELAGDYVKLTFYIDAEQVH